MNNYATFTVNGVSIQNYAKPDGLKISHNDIDGSNAGRSLSGDMNRDRLAVKVRIDVSCRDLKIAESMALLTAISGESFTVSYIDPQWGQTSITAYNAGWSSSGARYDPGRDTIWFSGIQFSLVEI